MKITEKGTLIVGVPDESGKIHKDFIMRPQLVKDSVAVLEDEQAVLNDAYFGAGVMAEQIETLGTLKKEEITTELVLNLTDVDFKVLLEKKEALEKRLRGFSGKDETDSSDKDSPA
jgi:hypothetical protein